MRTLLFLAFFLVGGTTALAQDFREGQTWQYNTRAREPGATLYIYKIETIENTRIYSLALTGLTIAAISGDNEVVVVKELPHVPVTQETLKASVTRLLPDAPERKIDPEGYNYWKTEFAAGKAGWWDIPVIEIVTTIEQELQALDDLLIIENQSTYDEQKK